MFVEWNKTMVLYELFKNYEQSLKTGTYLL